ncbi:U3 small nucleolar RNA-associated protein 4, partial [Lecanoromycetidae sp. Uapishka_2]
MDIHRCRFVAYPPSAINALAFSHPSNPTDSSKGGVSLRLAIGRANGDIEIWNPLKGAWYQESILRGGQDRSIEGLTWTQEPDEVGKNGHRIAGKLRLFSIGYSTAVTEWDLATGRPAQYSAGNYGEIWCMAAQPKDPATKNLPTKEQEQTAEEIAFQTQDIAVGCADGAIILLSTSEGDLRFSRVLGRASKKKSRVLSITFQNRHTVVAGHADSTIRIYDVRNAQQMRTMTLGAGPKGGPKETLVWSVKCLSDGTIVSGDSTGTVGFWDGRNHTLVQRIKSHEADILDLAVSADGKSVFSGDSRILAVADIAGYIDTWVLEGHEDLTQEEDQPIQKERSPASSDSECDSESDEENHPIIIYGQHWIRNPSASLLIKLPAAPLVFSFRPSSKTATKASTNGVIAPHPTRHTPHPHSHDLPDGEDRLLVLTAENQMYEFSILTGKISDWSRRNSTSNLPREFRDLRDRAMGAVWDVRGENERVWIYGVSWLWMFDLSKDMPVIREKDNEDEPKENGALVQLKRKRDIETPHHTPTKRPKHDTGAGSKIADSELRLGIGRKIQKIQGADGEVQTIDLAREPSPASDDDDYDEPVLANENQLLSLRRSNAYVEKDEELENGIEESDDPHDNELAKRTPRERPAYWHTYKYRPILGIVPLGEDEVDEGSGDQLGGIEVALVERPLWDVDLPPTFHGEQEWGAE